MNEDLRDHLPPAPAPQPLDPEERAALFRELAGRTIDQPEGPLDRIRGLPWAARTAIAATAMLGLGLGLAWITGMRGDAMVTLPATLLAVLAGVVGAGTALRPAGHGPRPWMNGLLVAVVLMPLAAALIPSGGTNAPPPIGGWPVHLRCGAFGFVTALVAGGVTGWLDRGAPGRLMRALGAAAAGGAAGFLATTLHCPWNDTTHVLIAHGSAGLMVAAVIAALRTRARPPAAA